jgi:hypothetical protein
MKGIYWNTNWLRDPQKLKHISDLTKEHNLKFIALLETGRSECLPSFLKFCARGGITCGIAWLPKGDLEGCS